MPEFIKDIPSDTTINKLDFENSTLRVSLTFWTEDTYLITFEEVLGYKLIPGWGLSEGIESVEIKTSDIFLDEVLKSYIGYGGEKHNVDQTKLFCFIQSNVPVLEIVARNYTITKA